MSRESDQHIEAVHGNYPIFYRIRADAVEIPHVLHGAMDYERVLFPDE